MIDLDTRRKRAFTLVSFLVFIAALFLLVPSLSIKPIVADAQSDCLATDIPVVLTMPSTNAAVRMNVYNGTQTPNLGAYVANDFRSRKFTLLKLGNEYKPEYSTKTAVIRFGPPSVGAAWLVRAYFINDAELVFDPNRYNGTIDVVVGGKFKKLGSNTEKNQALAQAGGPKLPSGTCDIS